MATYLAIYLATNDPSQIKRHGPAVAQTKHTLRQRERCVRRDLPLYATSLHPALSVCPSILDAQCMSVPHDKHPSHLPSHALWRNAGDHACASRCATHNTKRVKHTMVALTADAATVELVVILWRRADEFIRELTPDSASCELAALLDCMERDRSRHL